MLSKTDAKADKLHKNLFRIMQHFQHPNYAPPRQDNDIALYNLEEPITFNTFIRPICLAAPATATTFSDILGHTPFVTGWGRLDPGWYA